jgi:hypothetical protein
MLETDLANVAKAFAIEIRRLNEQKEGCNPRFDLTVSSAYSKELKIALSCHFYDGENFIDVKAASLDALVKEVNNRLGFADRQALENDRNERALTALEAPRGWASVEATDL